MGMGEKVKRAAAGNMDCTVKAAHSPLPWPSTLLQLAAPWLLATHLHIVVLQNPHGHPQPRPNPHR